MKRGQKASQRRLETKGERGLQMRVKKAESTAQKEDGKGLQKVEKGGKRELSKRVTSKEKWTAKER